MAGRLKAIEVAKLGPGMYGDGGGLYLVVQESGTRWWILRTMVCGKRCEIGLGGLSTRSLADARITAGELRAKARKGEDILTARRTEKAAEQQEISIPTFRQAAKEVLAKLTSNQSKKIADQSKLQITSEAHAYNWMQSLETYAFPVFGDKKVNVIELEDVVTALTPIWNKLPDTAARTLRRIQKVFDYCQAKGHRDTIINAMKHRRPHPCEGIRDVLPVHRRGTSHHESLPYQDLPGFIQKLRTSHSALSVKLAFEFLILTCARTGEVHGAKWSEFDIDKAIWTLPAGRMKMKAEHKVPLSRRCIEILRMAKEFNEDEFVFPGRYEGHPLSQMVFLVLLRRMGNGDLTAHGFRAT